jgi:hypothetical protein
MLLSPAHTKHKTTFLFSFFFYLGSKLSITFHQEEINFFIMDPDFKTCKMSISDKCSLNAHKSEFKGSYCRPCYKEYSRSYYRLNRAKLLARANARYVRTGEPRGRPRRVNDDSEADQHEMMELAAVEAREVVLQ